MISQHYREKDFYKERAYVSKVVVAEIDLGGLEIVNGADRSSSLED